MGEGQVEGRNHTDKLRTGARDTRTGAARKPGREGGREGELPHFPVGEYLGGGESRHPWGQPGKSKESNSTLSPRLLQFREPCGHS